MGHLIQAELGQFWRVPRVNTDDSATQPAFGLGKDLRLTGDGVSGAALWVEQRYIHVCAFTTSESHRPVGPQTRISRPARRRAR